MSLFASSRFVWVPAAEGRRNAFVLFRREFELAAVPAAATLLLFADSRYRLRVNGVFAASGPARFVTQFPEYDAIDLTPWLRVGANCLTVEVNAFGCSSYQTMPDQRGGFIAAGNVGEHDLTTPGAWQARRLEAWAEDSALLTFAQSAAEVCDLRWLERTWYLPQDPSAGWESPTVVTDGPWGVLQPRTAVPFTYPERRPARTVVHGELGHDEELFGFVLPERYLGSSKVMPADWRRAFTTTILSPRAQTVTVGVHWGDYWLNGQPVKSEWLKKLGNRSELTLHLHAGENAFCGRVHLLNQCEYWDFLLGLPKSAGLSLRFGDGIFGLSPTMPPDETAAWLRDGDPDPAKEWTVDSGDWRRLTPARITAWDRVTDTAVRDADCPSWPVEVAAAGTVLNLDLGTEYLGHVAVDAEGPAGTIVDLSYDEWLRPDGLVHLYRTNPFVNTTERFVLRGGREEVLTFQARGGRYVQVTVRPADGLQPARLHGVRVLETKTTSRGAAEFTCDDPLLEAVWFAGTETLIGSTEDAYSDSPWRERGTYVGDFTVNQAVQRLLDPDPRTARRGLRVYAQAQLPDGQIPAVAPAFHRRPLEDFTLIWILAVRANWAMTGDLALVRELWPAIERVWGSPKWHAHPDDDGLWSAEGLGCFIDWGALPGEKAGRANAVLNAFRIAALRASAELAQVLGESHRAQFFLREAEAVAAAFSRKLWLADENRYAPLITSEGELQRTSAWHANALAWIHRIGSEEQLAHLERRVLDLLAKNYQRGAEGGQGAGQLELYFLSYLLPALAERGHAAIAEEAIRDHWRDLVEDGFGTLPECFSRFRSGYGSRCHSWSGSPTVYLMQQIVGLRLAEPGNPDRWIVDPRPGPSLGRASGAFPHARGTIHVRWRRRDDGFLDIEADAPEGVDLTVAPSAGE